MFITEAFIPCIFFYTIIRTKEKQNSAQLDAETIFDDAEEDVVVEETDFAAKYVRKLFFRLHLMLIDVKSYNLSKG